MSLDAYQSALGRLIRGPEAALVCTDPGAPELNNDERQNLHRLLQGRGLRFTIAVQRSWCKGRARDAAIMTLSMLQEEQQQELLERWVQTGGGTSSFFANEAEAFLEFIAHNLPVRSHAMSICHMEQAVHRANRGLADLAERDAAECASLYLSTELGASPYSTVVDFFAEPDALFHALRTGDPLPPVGDMEIPLLFAPGLSGLFRHVSLQEASLWKRLQHPVPLVILLCEGYRSLLIDTLLAARAIDIVESASAS